MNQNILIQDYPFLNDILTDFSYEPKPTYFRSNATGHNIVVVPEIRVIVFGKLLPGGVCKLIHFVGCMCLTGLTQLT